MCVRVDGIFESRKDYLNEILFKTWLKLEEISFDEHGSKINGCQKIIFDFKSHIINFLIIKTSIRYDISCSTLYYYIVWRDIFNKFT